MVTNRAGLNLFWIISFLGHSLVLLVFVLAGVLGLEFYPRSRQKSLVIEVDIQEPSKAQKSFLRDVQVPDWIKQKKAENNEDPALFFSKETRRFQKQTRAATYGPQLNVLPNRLLPQSRLATKSSSTQASSAKSPMLNDQNNHDFVVTAGQEAKLGSEVITALSPQVSSLSAWVPEDIEIGQFTAINTDRWTYYSFFERIENKVRPFWVQLVRNKLSQLPAGVIRDYPRAVATTLMEIQLNHKGEVVRILLLRSSGIRELDHAHAEAFWKTKVIENPPADLIEEDGLIHLRYQFYVVLRK